MFLKKAVLLLFLAFLAQGVSSQVSLSKGFLAFLDEPQTLSFTVKNDSPFDQELEIKFFGPKRLGYEFIGAVPETVKAGSEERIEMRFFPSKELIGAEYRTELAVRLGEKSFEKKILMDFYAKIKENQEGEQENEGSKETGSTRIASGFAGLASFLAPRYLIDAVLVVVAAILLIAFIARLAKRTGVSK